MMMYEKPDLKELELELEGSFLGENSEGIGKGEETTEDFGSDVWD